MLHSREIAWSTRGTVGIEVRNYHCLKDRIFKYSFPRRSAGIARAGALLGCLLALLAFSALTSFAESCRSGADLDDATRTALNTAALHYFDSIAKGDTASLRQNAMPSLTADFSAIEAIVKDNQPTLAGAKPTARPPFLLEAEGSAPLAHAEFYCGVFGANGQTRDSAIFYLNNLASGKYGVVIMDANTPKGTVAVSVILQQQGANWKLAGLYIKAAQAAGHDSDWYISRARALQSKGQMHNAWLYYVEARNLASPLAFMSTAVTDKLYDDSQKLQPADFPEEGKITDLTTVGAAGTTPATYKLTAVFPDAVGNDLDLIVKYQAANISNTNLAYQTNVAVMKALLAKYPELREAFAAVVARAVDSSGRDYGTLLAMKEIK